MGRVAHIPPDVVVLVLEHVDVRYRLQTCALVSQNWASAAAAATTSISTSCWDVGVLMRYLEQQGSHVESLTIRSLHLQPLGRLPCSRLRSLDLHRFKLQLSQRSSSPAAAGQDLPGILHAATGLTRLCLPCGNYFEGRHELSALTALKKLQHLELQHTAGQVPEGSAHSWTLPSAILPGTVLAALTTLTFLHMPVADGDSFQHISSCAALQRLQLPRWDRFGAKPADLAGLKNLAQLSWLSISETPFELSTHRTPELAGLQHLQHLALSALQLQPDMLAAFTTLNHLDLANLWPLQVRVLAQVWHGTTLRH